MSLSIVDLGTNNNVSGPSTITITIPAGGVPAGSFICVGVAEDGPATAGGNVTDSKNNNYIKKVSAATNNNNSNGWGALSIVWNSVALVAGDVITNYKNNGRPTVIAAFYATGIDTSADPTNLNVGPVYIRGNPVVTGTPSIGDLVLGFASIDPRAVADTWTDPAGWGPPLASFGVSGGGGYVGMGSSHMISADGASVTWNPTISNAAARNMSAWLLSFRPKRSFGFNHPFP
jgi:hypothetical protein